MKKLIVVITCLLLVLTGCNNSSNASTKDVDLNTLMDEIVNNKEYELPSFMTLDDTGVTGVLGMNLENLDSYVISFPMMNVQATSIMMFKAKDGKLEDVKKELDVYLGQIENTWSQYLPDQYELVKNRVVYENGNYYFVIISEYASQIGQQIEEAFK